MIFSYTIFIVLVLGDAKRFFIQIWMVGSYDDKFEETLCLSENSPPAWDFRNKECFHLSSFLQNSKYRDFMDQAQRFFYNASQDSSFPASPRAITADPWLEIYRSKTKKIAFSRAVNWLLSPENTRIRRESYIFREPIILAVDWKIQIEKISLRWRERVSKHFVPLNLTRVIDSYDDKFQESLCLSENSPPAWDYRNKECFHLSSFLKNSKYLDFMDHAQRFF